jgi:uncharacterized protein (DUF1330 family)
LHEKGGEIFLDEYIAAAGIGDNGPLFRTAVGKTGTLTENAMRRIDAYRMICRRTAEAGYKVKLGCHTFRATGLPAYTEAAGLSKTPRRWPRTKARVRLSSMTARATRLPSMRSSGSRFDVEVRPPSGPGNSIAKRDHVESGAHPLREVMARRPQSRIAFIAHGCQKQPSMVAYLIADLDIRSPEDFQKYREGMLAFIVKHGGEFLAIGSELEVIEGNWQPHRLVLLRFPSKQANRNFFSDPEYVPLKEIRVKSTKTIAVSMEGME